MVEISIIFGFRGKTRYGNQIFHAHVCARNTENPKPKSKEQAHHQFHSSYVIQKHVVLNNIKISSPIISFIDVKCICLKFLHRTV